MGPRATGVSASASHLLFDQQDYEKYDDYAADSAGEIHFLLQNVGVYQVHESDLAVPHNADSGCLFQLVASHIEHVGHEPEDTHPAQQYPLLECERRRVFREVAQKGGENLAKYQKVDVEHEWRHDSLQLRKDQAGDCVEEGAHQPQADAEEPVQSRHLWFSCLLDILKVLEDEFWLADQQDPDEAEEQTDHLQEFEPGFEVHCFHYDQPERIRQVENVGF